MELEGRSLSEVCNPSEKDPIRAMATALALDDELVERVRCYFAEHNRPICLREACEGKPEISMLEMRDRMRALIRQGRIKLGTYRKGEPGNGGLSYLPPGESLAGADGRAVATIEPALGGYHA